VASKFKDTNTNQVKSFEEFKSETCLVSKMDKKCIKIDQP
jgi:hypothetical protein